ncbi:LysE family transporter [Streptomyces sp. R302]|uniref:LysE family transporter n=1 Tax=unclassified Streptomyces TaxID=2593676 RepID=UPI00145D3533|nr:LysE family transporter [Streptomyces sp. R301]NML79051.1 LysE family transporter [Streptomyces sp. R302]
MTGAAVAGLLAGYGIAVPVGAVGAHLVAVAARGPWRTGAGAALGIAAADGVYALVAVAGGAALVPLLAPVATPLRWASVLVLLALAAASARTALRAHRAHRAGTPAEDRPVTAPHRAFWTFLGITILNPMTVLYFTALVLGGHATTGPAQAAVFVAAAFAASASWQLLLAATGTLLGHALTGPRARLLTGLASSALIAVLAVGLAARG